MTTKKSDNESAAPTPDTHTIVRNNPKTGEAETLDIKHSEYKKSAKKMTEEGWSQPIGERPDAKTGSKQADDEDDE